MLLRSQAISSPHGAPPADDYARRARRKRKAEPLDNERLSKRLSLLNIERGGTRMYVPVENPHANANETSPNPAAAAAANGTPAAANGAEPAGSAPDMMQLDDSKHKVYIYNLDDELSSSDSEPDEGQLVFLPDIGRHLLANRIPARVRLPGGSEPAAADMQLVLYREPSALTVPEEQDGVRRAVIEARERLRERQRQDLAAAAPVVAVDTAGRENGDSDGDVAMDDGDAMDLS